MTDSEIIKLLGGVTAIARMLDIKPPSVSGWMETGIPEGRLRDLAGQIEIMSGGAFTRKGRWPDKYAFFWPELAETYTPPAPFAIEPIAAASAAIAHVEEVAVGAIRQGVADAVAQIEHVAEALIEQAAHPAWDGTTERRETDEPWDQMTERRKLGAPIDRRVSPESVAQAKFRARQGAAVKQQEGS